MREWLAICAVLFSMAGCGKDEVFIGLGHTYGQIEASSRGFIIDEKFPFRWRFDEALVHLDLGGVSFTLEETHGFGFVNNPDQDRIGPIAANWTGARVIGIDLYIRELVGLENAKTPQNLIALMDALSRAGWVPKQVVPSTPQALKALLTASPHNGEWLFTCPKGPVKDHPPGLCMGPSAKGGGSDSENGGAWPNDEHMGRTPWVSIRMRWQAEDEGEKDRNRRGVHASIELSSDEVINAPLKSDMTLTD